MRRPSQNLAAAISRRIVAGESCLTVATSFLGQAAEVAQLDDLRLPWIEPGHLVERLVQGQHIEILATGRIHDL